jgi:hypothetical protein
MPARVMDMERYYSVCGLDSKLKCQVGGKGEGREKDCPLKKAVPIKRAAASQEVGCGEEGTGETTWLT